MGERLDLAFVAVALGIVAIVGIVAMVIFRRPEASVPQPSAPAYVLAAQEGNPNVTKTEEIRPTRPHIINHILNEAGTWYEIRLPVDVVTWQMRARGDYDLYYSFEPAHSTTMVLPSGQVLSENTAPNRSIKSIYVMCETANAQVDIELWQNIG